MTATDRREFLRRAGLSAAGLTALSGPLQGVFARGALAADATGVAASNGGYGTIGPVRDQADGVVRLELPERFKYRSFSDTGTLTTDGIITPGRHDGMAAFAGDGGNYRLVRNHEVNGPGSAFGDQAKAYDGMAKGETLTLEVTPHASRVESWVSCNGTQMNCRRRHTLGLVDFLRGDGERARRRTGLHGRRQQLARAAAGSAGRSSGRRPGISDLAVASRTI